MLHVSFIGHHYYRESYLSILTLERIFQREHSFILPFLCILKLGEGNPRGWQVFQKKNRSSQKLDSWHETFQSTAISALSFTTIKDFFESYNEWPEWFFLLLGQCTHVCIQSFLLYEHRVVLYENCGQLVEVTNGVWDSLKPKFQQRVDSIQHLLLYYQSGFASSRFKKLSCELSDPFSHCTKKFEAWCSGWEHWGCDPLFSPSMTLSTSGAELVAWWIFWMHCLKIGFSLGQCSF